MQATFDYEGVTYTVRPETIRDALTTDIIFNLLVADRTFTVADSYLYRQFARFLIQTSTDQAGLMPDYMQLGPAELQPMAEAWGARPREFLEQWRAAMTRASTPPNKETLTPEKKKLSAAERDERESEQQRIDHFLTGLVQSKLATEPDAPEDIDEDAPGYYYPVTYVIQTWYDHDQFGLYPNGGAYDDQDPRLVEHDWRRIDERYNELFRRGYRDKKEADSMKSVMEDERDSVEWGR